MATIVVSDDVLSVRLSRGEKVAGLLGDITVPLAAITLVVTVPRGLHAPRGIRAPGLGLPGVRKIGTWRARGDRQYVSVRRHQPALRISLADQRYDTLVIGVADPEAVRRQIDAAS
ncbi:MAG: hypothetical protein JJE52_13215 [Acidimicrobiia bacterium]|nr:hypothetical protein [Acidimicrobiia bacterium]